MLKFLSFLIVVFSSTIAGAVPYAASAYRQPGVSYEAYMQTARLLNVPAVVDSQVTPMALAKPFAQAQATLTDATLWESEPVMRHRFQQLRDFRFMIIPNRPDFPRRSSWMYPDDGCFARAALAVRNLAQWSYPMPKKVFAFGNLTVKTNNAIGGEVSWWYHVAPLVQIGAQKYVLDPALSPKNPLKLEEWLARMSADPSSIQVSICESGSYTPGDDCNKVSDGIEKTAEEDQVYYLEEEWQRIRDLGRNAELELGDFPPWLQNLTGLN